MVCLKAWIDPFWTHRGHRSRAAARHGGVDDGVQPDQAVAVLPEPGLRTDSCASLASDLRTRQAPGSMEIGLTEAVLERLVSWLNLMPLDSGKSVLTGLQERGRLGKRCRR